MKEFEKVEIPYKLEFLLFHIFHSKDIITYANSLIDYQNRFITKYNKKNKIIKSNKNFGDIKQIPNQFNYEEIIKFEILQNNQRYILKVENIFFNNYDEPESIDKFIFINKLNPNNFNIILGGGINYLGKSFFLEKNDFIIIERYKTIKDYNIKYLGLLEKNFIDINYSNFLIEVAALKDIKNKNIIVHQPSYNMDKEWYDELIGILNT